MAKKAAKPRQTKQKTKPGVPGEAGNKGRSKRATKAAGQTETLPGIGHNGAPNGKPPKPEQTLSEKERKALLVQHVQDYKKVLERKKKADADLKNACKLIKAEGGKNQVDRVKLHIRLETPEGEAAVREELADIAEIAKWQGSPLGHQFSFDVDEPDRTPAVDRAYNEGESAGMAGEVAKPPYDPTTEQHSQWLSGWHAGNGHRIRTNIKKTQDQEPPEPDPSGPDEADEAERSAQERKLSNEQFSEAG